MTFHRKGIVLCLLCCLLFSATGCANTGIVFSKNTDGSSTDTEWGDGYDYGPYYDLFDGVTMLGSDGTEEEYDVEDSLFTETTCISGEWGDDDEPIPSDSYPAMFIRFEEETVIDDFSLMFLSDMTGMLDMYFYVFEEIPEKIPLYGEEYTEKSEDDGEGGNGEKIKDGYFVPDLTTALSHQTLTVGNAHNSLFVSKWGPANQYNTITVPEDQYLVILFYNNAGWGFKDGLSTAAFQPINLIICIG